MRNAHLKWLAIALLLANLTAAHALTSAGANRPVTVPANYLITPFGYFHPSCIRHLADGDTVQKEENAVRHADGTFDTVRGCAYRRYAVDGSEISGEEPPFISHSWIEAASTTTTSSFGKLTAEWTVPPTPTSKDGQTVYLFPGLEDINHVVTILQPVLGWNSDYASAWGIASWNCCTQGTVFEATPQRVNPGDTILGYMFESCAAGTLSCSRWNVVTLDLQSGKFSHLLMTSSQGQTFNWAFAAALEVYNIKQCSDYPSNGSLPGSHVISFNQIGLYNNKFAQITNPAWSVSVVQGLTPQCGYGGSLPKQVILNY
jgi:hypothetical protein